MSRREPFSIDVLSQDLAYVAWLLDGGQITEREALRMSMRAYVFQQAGGGWGNVALRGPGADTAEDAA